VATMQRFNLVISANHESDSKLPRVEVLSKFMRFSLDLAIRQIRILVDQVREHARSTISKGKRIEESIKRFLQSVMSYDLSFPHEEALAVTMQMCIDRLVAVGLQSEEAWEVSNLAMLKFLGEIADATATSVL